MELGYLSLYEDNLSFEFKKDRRVLTIFISEIQRLFHSGEIIRVVDNNNLDVYFYGGKVYLQDSGVTIPAGATTLSGKIVGVISSIKINPNKRGQ